MNTSTRLQLCTPNDGPAYPLNASVNELQPASHCDWLSSLRRGAMVRVQNTDGSVMPPAIVTNEAPCYLFVGKLKFWRRHGWQVVRQSRAVYRMRLRLVRDEKEFA